jgi:uncharacterized membrane protein YhaH (DUF805 family)
MDDSSGLSAPASVNEPPADWYRDPERPGWLRWWDGTNWTDHRQPQPLHPPAHQQPVPQLPLTPFAAAVKDAVKRTFDYSGRTTRSGYWWLWLAIWLIVLATTTIAGAASPGSSETANAVLGLLIVVFLVIVLPTAVRRLHDAGCSGWMLLLALIPLGGIVVFVFLVSPSKPPNKWGPPNYDLANGRV